MPQETIFILTAVILAFTLFAATLAWADHKTRA